LLIKNLEEKGFIMIGEKGILWIHNESPKMKKLLKENINCRDSVTTINKERIKK